MTEDKQAKLMRRYIARQFVAGKLIDIPSAIPVDRGDGLELVELRQITSDEFTTYAETIRAFYREIESGHDALRSHYAKHRRNIAVRGSWE